MLVVHLSENCMPAPHIWLSITFFIVLLLDIEMSLKNYNWFCKFSFGRYKIHELSNPFGSKQTEREKAAMRLGGYSMPDMTFLYRGKSPRSGCISGYSRTYIWNILLKPWCFNFSRNFWFLTSSYSVIILTMYGHQTRLSWTETRVKMYFLGRDYGMPYTSNKN